jgi:hypothetical protein
VSVEFGIVTSVVPPGGWHFPQVLSSGQTVKLTGFSFEQLLAEMLDFRMRHVDLCGAESARIESVRADLKSYLCAHFRQNCADSRQPPLIQVPPVASGYIRPIDRAATWLGVIGNQSIERVDPALAAQRAQICAQCRQNVHWQTGCQPCNENVLVRIQNAKGSVHTPYDKSLFTCRVYGWANEVAVWLTDQHGNPKESPPPHCWKVQENAKNTTP